MGNCCTLASSSSSMEWAGEDWGSLTSKHNNKSSSSKVFDDEVHDDDHHGLNKMENLEKERVLGSVRASADANGKVKIMISKKELTELLGEKHYSIIATRETEHQHASAEQVLARLINGSRDHVNDHHHGPWRPVLQSIPEVN